MYILNMVQHTKSGDVVAPALTYNSTDAWKTKYHHEMDYAMSNEDFIGLSILVTDGSLNTIFRDNWVKEPKPTTEE